MNTKPSPSLYRYWNSLRSTTSVSILAPALNVRSTTLPVITFLTLVRTNAPPLPGLTCWKSMTVQSWPSMLRTTPFRISLVEAMPVPLSLRAGSCGGFWSRLRDPQWYGLARRATNGVEGEYVRIETEARDHTRSATGNRAVVADFLTRVRVRDVHLDNRSAALRHEGDRIPESIRVVRERGRIQ